MNTSEPKLYTILRQKFSEQDTVELVHSVKSMIKQEVNEQANIFLTKEDKVDLIDRIDIFKTDVVNRIETIKADLIDRIHKSKTETIIWIVGVGILQFVLSIISKKIL